MCSFGKSPQAKSCVKTNCTQTPQCRHMTVRHENKAAYQIPKKYQLPKKILKKCHTETKQVFHTFARRGAFGFTGKRLYPLHPRTSPPHWETNLGSNCVETLIFTTRSTAELAGNEDAVELDSSPLARFKSSKIRQKLGLKKFLFFLAYNLARVMDFHKIPSSALLPL